MPITAAAIDRRLDQITANATLNAEITKEDAYIASQKTKLTAELNQANEILQGLPTQLTGMDELYSAITGYNQKS